MLKCFQKIDVIVEEPMLQYVHILEH